MMPPDAIITSLINGFGPTILLLFLIIFVLIIGRVVREQAKDAQDMDDLFAVLSDEKPKRGGVQAAPEDEVILEELYQFDKKAKRQEGGE